MGSKVKCLQSNEFYLLVQSQQQAMSTVKKVVDGDQTSGSLRIRFILTTSKNVANLEKVRISRLLTAFSHKLS